MARLLLRREEGAGTLGGDAASSGIDVTRTARMRLLDA
jgi:hypothetical protein